MVFGAHFEQTKGLEHLIEKGVRWSAGTPMQAAKPKPALVAPAT